MPPIEWHAIGARRFETGIDRGVLYQDGPGGSASRCVPWDGLVSVDETPEHGDVATYYHDGVSYHNQPGRTEFRATLEAYTYPEEFEEHLGYADAGNGLMIPNQYRKKFGLSYRTIVGNEVDGTEFAYKIHILYNVVVAPSDREAETIDDGVNPALFSWDIYATPPELLGYAPTAEFIVDSKTTPSLVLEDIEDQLYGSSRSMPTVAELLDYFD